MSKIEIKLSYISLLTILSVILLGCDSKAKQKQKEDNLARTVIEIHDDVMPKMDDIYLLKKKIKTFIPDSLNQSDSALAIIDAIKVQLDNLDVAHDAMMNWMREYNGGIDLFTHKEKMDYLNNEKVKIEKVRQLMLDYIEEAEKFVRENEPKNE